MPPKKAFQPKETTEDADTSTCELTVASLEATLQKFFAEANKRSRDRFERLGSQLDSLKDTLDKHTKDLESQHKITTSLQARMKSIEEKTSEDRDSLKKLQEKVTSMEDNSRRDNIRVINLKEGAEQGHAISYLKRILPIWFPELAACPPEIMRAHRVGPPRSSTDPPRTMILKCLRFSDRDQILGLARKASVVAEGRTIRFAADFSDVTARRRKACYPVMNRALALGFQAFLLYPAVIKLTRGTAQLQFSDPCEAIKYLDSTSPQDSKGAQP